ncbi:uncharacterized protein LOC124311934 [Daphnia pulicaria]|uniref:uncharacterized protein LOC124311934 n=1 Tax=Daphnia pulicaria TaxID=35523 RepID=UPI001EECD163|nr:uncharacterized protein LOC124311934 [Daphnia pulicaria]
MMPVNVIDVLQSSNGKVYVEDSEAKLITLVGTIEKIEPKINCISYMIRDDTGEIEVLLWVDIGSAIDSHNTKFSKGMFCRVVGSPKVTDGITHVIALNISKLSSANEITTHLLETQWIRMKLRQLKKNNASSDSQLPNSVITLAPQQRLIYTIVKAETNDIGIEKAVVVERVHGELPQREVE